MRGPTPPCKKLIPPTPQTGSVGSSRATRSNPCGTPQAQQSRASAPAACQRGFHSILRPGRRKRSRASISRHAVRRPDQTRNFLGSVKFHRTVHHHKPACPGASAAETRPAPQRAAEISLAGNSSHQNWSGRKWAPRPENCFPRFSVFDFRKGIFSCPEKRRGSGLG